MSLDAAADPFAHLHDEGYARGFAAGLVGVQQLVATGGRSVLGLEGDWHMTLDLFDEGLRQRWYALDDTPASQWATPRDFEREAGALVPVPSCWNVLKPEWTYFEGAAWFTRDFAWQAGEGQERVVLNVGAANYAALVFLNGVFVGAHRGGSTPFSIDLGATIVSGSNRLQIMVENRRAADRVPMHHFDWFNYGGLYRDISLLRLPRVHIRQATAALMSNRRDVRFTVTLSDTVTARVRITVPELGFSADMAVTDGTGTLVGTLEPELWSPDRPKLYRIAFQAGSDTFSETVGFRTIETQGQQICLNGAPVWLKGVCVHEDDLVLGKVSTEADVRRRFRHAKELGCNFLRLAHYPHHEHVARIADEEGLLLWAEIPVYWAIDFENEDTFADAQNQLLELIQRDMNRASVIFWGVGNENADTDARLSFMARLAAAARAADPTRLIGAACLINRTTFAIEDRLTDHLDVIGINEYFGWYEPDFTGLDRLLANSAPDKPVIVSETGADALSGHRGAGRMLFTEDWQAEFFAQQFARLLACPYIVGVAVWLLYDFRSARRQTGFQQGFNRKGLIGEDKETQKLGYAAVRAAYRPGAVPKGGSGGSF